MKFVICLTRPEGRTPIVIGTYTGELGANDRARALNERFSASDEYLLAGCAATVVPLWTIRATVDELVDAAR